MQLILLSILQQKHAVQSYRPKKKPKCDAYIFVYDQNTNLYMYSGPCTA